MKNKFIALAALPFLTFLLAADKEQEKPCHQFWFTSASGWDTIVYANDNPITRGGTFNSNNICELSLWLRLGKNTVKMESNKLNPEKQELQLHFQMRTMDGDGAITDTKDPGALNLDKTPDKPYIHQFEFFNPSQRPPMLWAKADRIQKLTAEDRAAITKLVEHAADALRKKNFSAFLDTVTPVWGDGDAPAGILPRGTTWPEAKKMWLEMSKTIFSYDDYAVKFVPPEKWEWSVGSQIVMVSLAPFKEYPKDANKDYGVEIVKAGHGKEKGGSSFGFSQPKFIKLNGQWKMLTP